jgi:hypothetical protein
MAITPSYKAEGTEEHYIDKGAVKTPQVNPMSETKYRKALVEADIIDYVEWPTKVAGQEVQGF